LKNIAIELLNLSNYRNYSSLKVSFSRGFNIITGLNGAGKTSILDAIYYLSNGKSYFTHLDKFIYKTGTDFFMVEGEFNDENRPIHNRISSAVKSKKSIVLDDKKLTSRVDLMGVVPAAIVAPKDIRILVDSSVERRRVTDRTISHSDKIYLQNLVKYNKALKQRNAYLKEINKKGLSDSTYLDSLDQQMIGPADYIHEARASYVDTIAPLLSSYYKELSGNSETVSLQYQSQLTTQSLAELFKERLRRDIATVKTSAGIHRDDLELFIEGQPLKKYASQGQLKSAVIALKLAQASWLKEVTGINPILLLDDIFDKLDSERVKNFMKVISQVPQAQILITDTDKQRIITCLNELDLTYNSLHIEDGKLIDGIT